MPSLVSQRCPCPVKRDDGSPTGERAPQKIAHILTSLLPECSAISRSVAEEALKVRTEAARLADRQFEQNAALSSARDEAHAKMISATASSLEANLGFVLAQGELVRTLGELPR
jgi:hypothetical protein